MKDLSNEEVLKRRAEAWKWLEDHTQVTGTNKDSLGNEITQERIDRYMKVLRAYEEIEKELQKRGIEV